MTYLVLYVLISLAMAAKLVHFLYRETSLESIKASADFFCSPVGHWKAWQMFVAAAVLWPICFFGAVGKLTFLFFVRLARLSRLETKP